MVGILAEDTTVSKATGSNGSGNNTGTWTPGPQLPPRPPAKGESEPLLFPAQSTCMLIHSSIELGRGRGYHESRDTSDCMEFPALMARMASHPLGNSQHGLSCGM